MYGRCGGFVYADRYFSEMGNRLAELHPEYDFIAMIDVGGGMVSYRTVKDDINLGELAKQFGGGGHPKSAGSRFDPTVCGVINDAIFISKPEKEPEPEYTPVCPHGESNCVCDPAYIKLNYPDWYADLYGTMTPEEAAKNCDEGRYPNCYDDEDK